jgi:hypothetical protein
MNWDWLERLPKYFYCEAKSNEYNTSHFYEEMRGQLPYDLIAENIQDDKLVSEIRDYYGKRNISVAYIFDGIDCYYPSIRDINTKLYKE